jgi:hypothetical protein
MVSSCSFDGAMVDHIGMREAVGRLLAMAEGKGRWRHDEAQRREPSKKDREPEAEPGRELVQHDLKANPYPQYSSTYWPEAANASIGPPTSSIALLER